MLTYASLSENGNRPYNEDSFGTKVLQGDCLFALADGLGGHGKGEVASAIAIGQSLDTFETETERGEGLLPSCVLASQYALLEAQRLEELQDQMKTTLVLLRVAGEMAQWIHVGDSRLYCFQEGGQMLRTLDHSVPQMLVAAGELRERDIRFHEDRNRLVRVLGMEWDAPKYTLSDRMPLAAPTSFLLLSDGFWEYISDKQMQRCLRRAPTPEAWLEGMRRIVQRNGKRRDMDNYTAIAVYIR